MSDPHVPDPNAATPPPPQQATPQQPPQQVPPQQTVVYVDRGPAHVARPGGVTLLMVLGIIQGLMTFVTGLILAIESDNQTLIDESQMSSDALLATGIGIMVGGGIIVLLAVSLGRGSQLVRWLYGIVTMVNVAFGAWGVFALQAEQRLSAMFSLVFGLIVLWILFGSERTDRFFSQD